MTRASQLQSRGAMFLMQYAMLLLDCGINIASPMLYQHNTLQLVLYVLQDTTLVMALIVLFLSFFATYVFQAGLIAVMLQKFRATIVVIMLYLTLSIAYHVCSLKAQWGRPTMYIWNPLLTFLYVAQRTGSAFYYYFYKRTSMALCDPRYYQDSPWLRQQLQKRR